MISCTLGMIKLEQRQVVQRKKKGQFVCARQVPVTRPAGSYCKRQHGDSHNSLPRTFFFSVSVCVLRSRGAAPTPSRRAHAHLLFAPRARTLSLPALQPSDCSPTQDDGDYFNDHYCAHDGRRSAALRRFQDSACGAVDAHGFAGAAVRSRVMRSSRLARSSSTAVRSWTVAAGRCPS